MTEAIIQIQDLEKRFRSKNTEVYALQGINLTIRKGDIFGIIGKSGAGKSTLVRCINMLERPTGGSVMFEGRDMCRLCSRDLQIARRSMGMIFQQFNLLMQRTAEENICFPLELAGVKKDAARERARELLELVNLSDRAQSYPSQLSGGQKQRVAIARALATNPKILLCDEATSALDPATTESILSLIKDINRRLGITAIIITHEMSVIEKICNQVAIISHGGLPKPARSKRFSSTLRPKRRASSSSPRPCRTCRTAGCTGSFSTAAPRSSRSSAIWCWNAGLPSTSCLPTRATSAGRHSARWCCNFRTTKRSSGVSSPMPTPRD